MSITLMIITLMVSAHQYQDNWQYVGHHECNQVGIVEQTKAKVYHAQVEGYKPYILFKQKNKDGTYTVSCVLEKPDESNTNK